MYQKKKMSIGEKVLIGIGVIVIIAIIGSMDDETSSNQTSEFICNFNKLEISAIKVGSNKVLDSKTLNECFQRKIVDKSTGLIQVSNESKSIKLLYYLPKKKGVLETLDVFLNTEEPTRWRENQGHDIFLLEKGGDMVFIFSDKKKVKASMTFSNQ